MGLEPGIFESRGKPPDQSVLSHAASWPHQDHLAILHDLITIIFLNMIFGESQECHKILYTIADESSLTCNVEMQRLSKNGQMQIRISFHFPQKGMYQAFCIHTVHVQL